MENEKQQEIIFKLSMFEQQMRQMQEQINSIESGLNDLSFLNLGLNDLNDSTGKDILAPVGRGIFVKAKIASEDLIVDVGSKNLVKKNIPETQEIIKEQISKLKEVKEELEENIEKVSKEAQQLISSIDNQEV